MKPKRSLQDMFDRLKGREPVPLPAVPEPQPLAVTEARKPPQARNRAELARVSTSLYGKAASILESALSTFDLSDEELRGKGAPARWVAECDGDVRAAEERFRVAREARLDKRSAPVALDIAEKVHTNQTRIQSQQKQRDIPLGAVVVQMMVPLPEYEVRQIVETTSEDDTEWLDD